MERKRRYLDLLESVLEAYRDENGRYPVFRTYTRECLKIRIVLE